MLPGSGRISPLTDSSGIKGQKNRKETSSRCVDVVLDEKSHLFSDADVTMTTTPAGPDSTRLSLCVCVCPPRPPSSLQEDESHQVKFLFPASNSLIYYLTSCFPPSLFPFLCSPPYSTFAQLLKLSSPIDRSINGLIDQHAALHIK